MKTQLVQPIIFVLLINFSCTSRVYYLDSSYPGLAPKKYAQGAVNISGRFLQNITMSSNGKEILLGETDSLRWIYERILRIRLDEYNRMITDTPEFVKKFKYERMRMIGEPMLSPNNQDLFFVADYPPDYWHSKRSPTGDWSLPAKMDSLSSADGDWYMSMSKTQTLYFTNGRIYKSYKTVDGYKTRIKIEGEFNQLDAGDPCISPNEDYMIFASTRDGGYGQGDIYVCFKNSKDEWSKAYNLGHGVNTEYWESAPLISPDEKYLFFSRRDKDQHAKFQDIYWVSLKIIDKIKNENRVKK